MTNTGIDYGMGQANIDLATGIRYGAISANNVGDVWDDLEHIYIERCPDCGDSENLEETFDGYSCNACGQDCIDPENLTGDEADSIVYDKNGLLVEYLASTNIFLVFKSPYVAYTKFCSPCLPGAGDLDTPIEGGVKTYALPHDWFVEDMTPYPVYPV